MRFLILVILFVNLAAAQDREQVSLLPAVPDTRIRIPFSGIEVVDARFDRTNIGGVQNKIQKQNKVVHKKIEIDFPDSFHRYFPLVLDRIISFDNDSREKLVILVKRFRMVDWVRTTESDPELVLSISCSFFSRNGDEYIKTGSVDETLSEQLFVARKKFADTARTAAFTELLLKIFDNQTWQKTATAYTKDQFESGISKRFFYPVFTDSSRRAGIYRSFSEFLNNSPSITDIRIVTPENEHTDIKDKAGKIIEPGNFWGASDGKDLFIVFRKTFYKLHPRDRSFIIESFRSNEDQRRPPDYAGIGLAFGLAGVLTKKAMENKNEVFYLNMENGKIHLEEIFGTSGLQQHQKEILEKQR